MVNNLYRCWSLNKNPDKELENILNKQLYFSPVKKYWNNGEFEFNGLLTESIIEKKLCKELHQLRHTNYKQYSGLANKLSNLLGLLFIGGDADYIEKLSNAFARNYKNALNNILVAGIDNKTRLNLSENIGMLCFSNYLPEKKLLEDKGILNGDAVCCVFERESIMVRALTIPNTFIIPKVVYTDIIPNIDYCFYEMDINSIEHFINFIISIGSRLRSEFGYENEFRLLKIIGNRKEIDESNQFLNYGDGGLVKIMFSRNDPSSEKNRNNLQKLKEISKRLDIPTSQELC
jgi:hypothetical protein